MRAILASILVSVLVACGGGGGDSGDDSPRAQCDDGIDNDGDGTIDFPEDLGCTSAADETEDSLTSPQCNDGRDNDNDGRADYPADPGCFAPQQDDEVDDCPDGPNCPECGNGKDDDSNGSKDYPDDPGCTSASDGTEVINNPVACGAGLVIKQLPTTNTADGMLDGTSVSSVASPCGGGGGTSAVAYQLYLPRPKVVTVSTDDVGTTADTVIDIRKGECTTSAAEVACNDDAPGTTTGVSKLTASLAAGNYYIIISGHDSSITGSFTMAVKLFAGEGSTCGADPDCGPGLVCRIPLGASAKTCQQPMCKDGVDDDGDGKNDYPTDPGCSTPDDNTETDMCPGAGPNCAECGDGIDNDGDMKIDYPMDTTCMAAGDSSESCTTTDGVTTITANTTNDTTVGAFNDVHPTCASSSTHTAPDQTYRIDVPAMASLDFNLTNQVPSGWDKVHALYGSTCQTSLGCAEFGALHVTNLAAGTYFYVVDGWDTESGSYTINVTGKIANNSSCETPFFTSGAFTCNTNYVCAGTAGSRTCRGAACDDGQDNDGDGKFDYPEDPGCASLGDNDETNPATPPVCSDVTASTTMSTTAGLTNNFASQSCISSTGPDVVYALSLPVPVTSLQVDTIGSSFDTVLSVRDAACGVELGCDDEGGGSATSKLTLGNVPRGNLAIIVDGWSGQSGTYKLNIKGTVAAQTACSSPLFSGGANAVLSCPTGTTCTGTPAKCQ
jgi:hypothetical protein